MRERDTAGQGVVAARQAGGGAEEAPSAPAPSTSTPDLGSEFLRTAAPAKGPRSNARHPRTCARPKKDSAKRGSVL